METVKHKAVAINFDRGVRGRPLITVVPLCVSRSTDNDKTWSKPEIVDDVRSGCARRTP
jgi:hypothetical protein